MRRAGSLEFPERELEAEFASLGAEDGYPIESGRLIPPAGLDIEPREFPDRVVEEGSALHGAYKTTEPSRQQPGMCNFDCIIPRWRSRDPPSAGTPLATGRPGPATPPRWRSRTPRPTSPKHLWVPPARDRRDRHVTERPRDHPRRSSTNIPMGPLPEPASTASSRACSTSCSSGQGDDPSPTDSRAAPPAFHVDRTLAAESVGDRHEPPLLRLQQPGRDDGRRLYGASAGLHSRGTRVEDRVPARVTGGLECLQRWPVVRAEVRDELLAERNRNVNSSSSARWRSCRRTASSPCRGCDSAPQRSGEATPAGGGDARPDDLRTSRR